MLLLLLRSCFCSWISLLEDEKPHRPDLSQTNCTSQSPRDVSGPSHNQWSSTPTNQMHQQGVLQPAHWWLEYRELVNKCCWFQDTTLQSGLLYSNFQMLCNSLHRFIMDPFCLLISPYPHLSSELFVASSFWGSMVVVFILIDFCLCIPWGLNFLHSVRSPSEFPLPNCHCQFLVGIMSSPILFGLIYSFTSITVGFQERIALNLCIHMCYCIYKLNTTLNCKSKMYLCLQISFLSNNNNRYSFSCTCLSFLHDLLLI